MPRGQIRLLGWLVGWLAGRFSVVAIMALLPPGTIAGLRRRGPLKPDASIWLVLPPLKLHSCLSSLSWTLSPRLHLKDSAHLCTHHIYLKTIGVKIEPRCKCAQCFVVLQRASSLCVNRIGLSGCSTDKASANKDAELITTQRWAQLSR